MYEGTNQTLPSPQSIDFVPGELLGCVSGELGLRRFVEDRGHQLITISNKNGAFDSEMVNADVIISQPFWPAYMTADRIRKCPKVKLIITAGVGSDHVALDEASSRGITVAEITNSNSTSVAEHNVMLILNLVRNFVPAHNIAVGGGWNVADCAANAYDLEGMVVATIGAGRIGLAVMKRLAPFGVHMCYSDPHRLPLKIERDLNLTYHPNWQSMIPHADVVCLNCPLYTDTDNMINADTIRFFKKGAYLVNTARGRLCDAPTVAQAIASGHLGGYGGDVWFPQPAQGDHPWRAMPRSAMSPHYSGATLSAQARIAAGVREVLECVFDDKPIRPEYLIVHGGRLAGMGEHSYVSAKIPADEEASALSPSSPSSGSNTTEPIAVKDDKKGVDEVQVCGDGRYLSAEAIARQRLAGPAEPQLPPSQRGNVGRAVPCFTQVDTTPPLGNSGRFTE